MHWHLFFSAPFPPFPFVVKLVRDDAAFATEIECTAFLTNLTVAGVLISVSICIAWACNDYIKNKSNQSSEPTWWRPSPRWSTLHEAPFGRWGQINKMTFLCWTDTVRSWMNPSIFRIWWRNAESNATGQSKPLIAQIEPKTMKTEQLITLRKFLNSKIDGCLWLWIRRVCQRK